MESVVFVEVKTNKTWSWQESGRAGKRQDVSRSHVATCEVDRVVTMYLHITMKRERMTQGKKMTQ
jgi:hypothetical protein